MSDVKVREDGYYLVKDRDYTYQVNGVMTTDVGELKIKYICDNCIHVGYEDEYIPVEEFEFAWISEYPLNLEQLAINDGYNAAIIKKVQDGFGVKIGEDGEDVI